MWEAYLYGALLRMAQALLQTAPFLVTGLFIGGVLQRFVGRGDTRRLFGAGTWRSLPQAWAVGMLLPVCSFGVIPVVREMRRAGLSGGTILAFALAAPLFNPLSLLYGLTLSEPFTILAFALCSLLVVTVVGIVWDRLCPGSAVPAEPLAPTTGIKRMLGIGVVGARELTGPTLGYVVIGLLGVGALSLALPPTSMQRSVQHDDPWAPLVMAAVAVPAYASPMTAMSQLGSMFQHGNSVGAAFALLVLGAGVNLGLVAWMIWNFGWRKASLWFALLSAVVVLLSYGVERPLYPKGIEAADHTHAFDVYCRPYTTTSVSIPRSARNKLRQDTPPNEVVSLAILGAVLAAGVVLRIADPTGRCEAWLERGRESSATPAWYNRRVPASSVGLLALGFVVARCRQRGGARCRDRRRNGPRRTVDSHLRRLGAQTASRHLPPRRPPERVSSTESRSLARTAGVAGTRVGSQRPRSRPTPVHLHRAIPLPAANGDRGCVSQAVSLMASSNVFPRRSHRSRLRCTR
jgi:uncharacterized membrane protein YraQ (UPF0718 family)